MITVSNGQDDVGSAFGTPELGKKHLIYALDSGDRQIFLSALHDVIDAIVEEIESDKNDVSCSQQKLSVFRGNL